MPIAGFKVGDRVLTPAHRRGTVIAMADLYATVRYDKPGKLGAERVYRQAALRLLEGDRWNATSGT
jgi:hypothetical protein